MTLELVATWNVGSTSISSWLTSSHDVLLMLSSGIGKFLVVSRVQPIALATHALKDLPLKTLVLADDSSLVLVALLML